MQNTGISFGIQMNGVGWVSLLILVILGCWWWRRRYWGLGLMMIGGGLNWIERMTTGHVLDYWKIPFLNLYNNFNDWLIAVGLVVLIIELWRKR